MSPHAAPRGGRRRAHGLARARLAHRRGQAALLLVLAALLAAAAATGPLYERAVEQAAVRSVLASSSVVGRGLELQLDQAAATSSVTPTGRARELFDTPVAGTDVPAQFSTSKYPRLATTVTYRDRQCSELVLSTGRCPSAAGEVVASTSLAKAIGLAAGASLTVRIPALSGDRAVSETLQVVGLYEPFDADGPYWFGHDYSSTTGVVDAGDSLAADAFFGTQDYVNGLADALQTALPGSLPTRTVDFSLRQDAVSVDDIPVLRSTIASLSAADRNPQLTVRTGLSDDLDQIDAQRNDARTIVLLLAVQLAALATIALAVVVTAAADQRRPELALLRLRGLGRGRTVLAVTRELGAVVVAGVIPGVVLAWALTWAASVVWLRQGVRPELRWPVAVAAVAAVAVGIAVVVAIAWRAARAPISSLLRDVPVATRRGVGLVEVGVTVVAVAGLVTAVSGVGGTGGDGSGSPIALLTPTCLAVVFGIAASRAVELLARRSGRRQLAKGAVARGLALLAIARRNGARLTVVVLAAATGLVVFAGQQSSVATVAREQRAAAVVGAPVVLQVSAENASTLLGGVRAADPSGRYATPVVVVRPPGIDSEPVVAVDPAGFGAVATWGRDALRPSASTLASLTPRDTAPEVTVTTAALTLDLSSVSWSSVPGANDDADTGGGLLPTSAPPTPTPSLVVDLQHADGRISTATFGPLPATTPAGGLRLTGDVDCTDGCRLAGLGFSRPVLDSTPLQLDLRIASLTTAAGDAVQLGPGSAWGSTTPDTAIAGTSTTLSMEVGDGASATGLAVTAVDSGGNASAQHLDVPVALPVVAAGAPPTVTDASGAVTAATLSGGTAGVKVVGSVPFVPQVGSPALLVDLDLAARVSPTFDVTASPAVWLSEDSPAREKALVATLRERGVDVVSRATTADQQDTYSRTAPGWSNQLALIVGVLAELLAVLLVVLVVLTGRRVRQRDLAGLRLVGIERRTLQRSTLWELGLLVAVGVVGGVVAGVIGVVVSLPSIPVFVADPPVPISIVRPLQWVWLIGTVVFGLVLLVPTVVAVARRLVAGAGPTRLIGDRR